MIPKFFPLRSNLDRAIFASVMAMLAMNLFVLTQQLQPAPVQIAAQGTSLLQQA